VTKAAEAPRRTNKHPNSRFNRLLASGLAVTLGLGTSACANLKGGTDGDFGKSSTPAPHSTSHTGHKPKHCDMPDGHLHPASDTSPKQAKSIAKAMVYACYADDDPAGQWAGIVYIDDHESGFNPMAVNPDGGACGMEQALPCNKETGYSKHTKVSSHNQLLTTTVEHETNWQANYIIGRYGDPKAAEAFWQANDWY
jgi:hypothetical protein